jgi:hypothetical protein
MIRKTSHSGLNGQDSFLAKPVATKKLINLKSLSVSQEMKKA